MNLNYIHFALITLIAICSGDNDNESFQEGTDKTETNLKLARLYSDGGANQRYDWPPTMLKDTSQDIWGKGVISKKFHEWPAVLPWAKGGTSNGYRRVMIGRKKRRDDFDGSDLVDLDPDTFNDRHKVIAPKLKSDRRLWPYSLY